MGNDLEFFYEMGEVIYYRPDYFVCKGMKYAYGECPRCGGRLQYKNSKWGGFLGCSKFWTTGCRYKKNVS